LQQVLFPKDVNYLDEKFRTIDSARYVTFLLAICHIDVLPAQSVPIASVQALMRHASFRTTMDSYTQTLDEPNRLVMQSGKVGHA